MNPHLGCRVYYLIIMSPQVDRFQMPTWYMLSANRGSRPGSRATWFLLMTLLGELHLLHQYNTSYLRLWVNPLRALQWKISWQYGTFWLCISSLEQYFVSLLFYLYILPLYCLVYFRKWVNKQKLLSLLFIAIVFKRPH